MNAEQVGLYIPTPAYGNPIPSQPAPRHQKPGGVYTEPAPRRAVLHSTYLRHETYVPPPSEHHILCDFIYFVVSNANMI